MYIPVDALVLVYKGQSDMSGRRTITYRSGTNVPVFSPADDQVLASWHEVVHTHFMEHSQILDRLAEARFAFVEHIRHAPSHEPLVLGSSFGAHIQQDKNGRDLNYLQRNEERRANSSHVEMHGEHVLEASKQHYWHRNDYGPHTAVAGMTFGELLLAASPIRVSFGYNKWSYACILGSDLWTALHKKMLSPKVEKPYLERQLSTLQEQVREQPGSAQAQANIRQRLEELNQAPE